MNRTGRGKKLINNRRRQGDSHSSVKRVLPEALTILIRKRRRRQNIAVDNVRFVVFDVDVRSKEVKLKTSCRHDLIKLLFRLNETIKKWFKMKTSTKRTTCEYNMT